MNSARRGTDRDGSREFGAFRSPLPGALAVRAALALAGIAGVFALTAATFSTVIGIDVGTAASKATTSGWDRHGPALLLLAVLALALLGGALRGARPAAAALAVAGVAALAIALVWDRPDVHDTGSVGDLYAEARAEPGTGYYLETLGGALLLLAGGSLFVLDVPERRRTGTPPAAEPPAAD